MQRGRSRDRTKGKSHRSPQPLPAAGTTTTRLFKIGLQDFTRRILQSPGWSLIRLFLAISAFVVVQSLSRVRLFVTPWTVARQAPLSMGLSWQEYWSGLPFPSPGDLPDPGIGPVSPALAGGFFTTKPPEKPHELSDLSFYWTIHNESILSKKFAVNKYMYNHCLKLRNTLPK